MKKAAAIKVFGKVQNVGFRFHTRKMAEIFNITGFVKNESDGTVYIEACGDALNLNQFIAWCKSGPDWARVDKTEISDLPLIETNDFKVK